MAKVVDSEVFELGLLYDSFPCVAWYWRRLVGVLLSREDPALAARDFLAALENFLHLFGDGDCVGLSAVWSMLTRTKRDPPSGLR